MFRIFLVAASLLTLATIEARAVEPDEILSDPKLEARAREISLNLRCLVCQNQSIDDSNAELAKDLRVLVRERLTKGDTNDETTDYIVDRYGEYVLLKPRVGMHTMILWFGPLALLLFAMGYIYMNWSAKQARVTSASGSATGTGSKVKELSSEEQVKLDKLMDGD